jgi:hypothetical protein
MLWIPSLFGMAHQGEAQLFDEDQYYPVFPSAIGMDEQTLALDFTGDGLRDLLVYTSVHPSTDYLIYSNLGTTYTARDTIIPKSDLFLDDTPYKILIHSNPRDSLDRVFLLSTEKSQIISYSFDPNITLWDHYKIMEKFYDTNGLADIYHACLGTFFNLTSSEKTVGLITLRHGKIQWELHSGFFDYLLSTHDLPEIITHKGLAEIPQGVWVGKISDDTLDDLVFEMSDHWLVWITPEFKSFEGIYTGDYTEYRIPYPVEYKKTNSVLFRSRYYTPLLIAVQTVEPSPLAYVVIEGSIDGHIDFDSPKFVELAEKPAMGTDSYLFEYYENETTHYPLLVIGNPANPVPLKQNPYSIFRLWGDIDSPDFVQVLDPSLLGRDMYFNRPLFMDDFNGDRISDLVFSVIHPTVNGIGVPITRKYIYPFLGQPQTTAIPAREWLRQD